MKEKLQLGGKFPGGPGSDGCLGRRCLMQFLFLLTGLEIKTPERSEQWCLFLATLTSPRPCPSSLKERHVLPHGL